MEAYVILSGGGIKGAALAGCLSALENLKIDIAGYGGASAGSVVGLLASIGYKGDDLRKIMSDFDFSQILDDNGAMLNDLAHFIEFLQNSSNRFKKVFQFFREYRKISKPLKQLGNDYGLYNAKKLEGFIREKIISKYPSLSENRQIEFGDLKNMGAKPLKVVASDVTYRKPVIYPNDSGKYGQLVVDAIRASTCYPFVFKPLKSHRSRLVDGGLSSNFPTFLFSREKEAKNLPIIAFEIITPEKTNSTGFYSIWEYVVDLIGTSLEASDLLIRDSVQRIIHVPIRLDEYYPTLEFGMGTEKKLALFDMGKTKTWDYFSKIKPFQEAKDKAQKIQALTGPPAIFRPVLRGLVRDLSVLTEASNIRCSIMMPTGAGTQVVVYNYNMEDCDDKSLELNIYAGCSGACWTNRTYMFADLSDASNRWKMTDNEWVKMPKSQKAMMSFPVWDLSSPSIYADNIDDMKMIATLNVDTETEFGKNNWAAPVEIAGEKKLKYNSDVLKLVKQWADVIGKMLT